ncbi:MAG TPA: putative phage tail protein [Ruminiclostridium sp.]|nr:putative phage tail protein [Ruminiclostridium sp.]
MNEYIDGTDAEIAGEKNLFSYMPGYYAENYIMSDIQNSISVEFTELEKNMPDILKQLFVSTSTWGLKLWETELAIPVDSSKPEGTRRNTILGKIKGLGVTTPEAIKELAELFTGGEVRVTELYDKYTFVVKFTGVRGVPPQQNDLHNAIKEIKPAHLDCRYEYTYLNWFEALTYLWEEAHKFTWDIYRVQKPKAGSKVTWGIVYFVEGIHYWNSLNDITWEKLKNFELNIIEEGF